MQTLLSELADLALRTPELRWAVPMMQGLPLRQHAPRHLPVADLIAKLPVPPAMRGPVMALKDNARALNWQQSYSAEDGFSQDWLDAYGWVSVVSPTGPFVSPRIRVGVAYWGAGQHYPPHAHGPEETYVVLAGSAEFAAQGRAPIHAKPGDVVQHAPWQPHAMTMGAEPLLAAAYWRGDGLMDKSRLDVTLDETP